MDRFSNLTFIQSINNEYYCQTIFDKNGNLYENSILNIEDRINICKLN